MLIEDGFLPAIPRWRTLIATLSFWQRLIGKALCSHARKISARWQVLTTKQRVRFFWKKIERDPTAEIAIAPAVLTAPTLSRLVCCGREVPVRPTLNALLPRTTLVRRLFLDSHSGVSEYNDEPNVATGSYSFTSVSSLLPASTLFAQLKSCRLEK